jgi:hypothetical protein
MLLAADADPDPMTRLDLAPLDLDVWIGLHDLADPATDAVAQPSRLLVVAGEGPAGVTAREGALKVREASRFPAEGYDVVHHDDSHRLTQRSEQVPIGLRRQCRNCGWLVDPQQYQDADDDHEEAAEQDGRSDLEPFVKAMAHPGDGIQGRDPARYPPMESYVDSGECTSEDNLEHAEQR